MKKEKKDLSMFAETLKTLGFDDSEKQKEVINLDENVETEKEDDDIPDLNDTEEDNKIDNNAHDDDSDIPENILNESKDDDKQADTKINVESDDIETEKENEDVDEETEKIQVGAFFDAFAESLGWDISDDEKPNSIEDLIGYIQEVVNENSKPDYADERIQQLDEYVKNGGNFEDFYTNMSQAISYDDLNMEDESNQKLVVKDYLKLQGYSDDQINKKITRYEDVGVLEEEAVDAVARLKQHKLLELQQQEEYQQNYIRLQEKKSMEFVSNLNNTISKMQTIRGVNIPQADKKALFDYITKVDGSGMTQYQKDFGKNMINNLIESAYFTMKGDTLINEATKAGLTSAANKLRKMLKHQTKNHSTYNTQENKQRSVADIASKWFN